MHSVDFLYSLSGFFIGALVGMTGVGGGSLMTPTLILLFGVPAATAVGTDLIYAAVTKAGGAVVHGVIGTIEWGLVARLAAGSVPTTVLTLLALSRFDLASGSVQHALSFALGVALLATAMALVFRPQLVSWYGARVGELSKPATSALTVLTGAMLGVLVSLTSVGAGALGVTALILLYPRLPIARIVGSDIAHAVPLTLIAGIGHWYLAAIDSGILGALLIGSLPGIVVGSQLATRFPDPALRFALAAALMVGGGKLLL
ncbi:MAG TPA: sulfite exporter TauE/SafE family protein [Stellaceae bacterium]|jgi:hypothetical protein